MPKPALLFAEVNIGGSQPEAKSDGSIGRINVGESWLGYVRRKLLPEFGRDAFADLPGVRFTGLILRQPFGLWPFSGKSAAARFDAHEIAIEHGLTKDNPQARQVAGNAALEDLRQAVVELKAVGCQRVIAYLGSPLTVELDEDAEYLETPAAYKHISKLIGRGCHIGLDGCSRLYKMGDVVDQLLRKAAGKSPDGIVYNEPWPLANRTWTHESHLGYIIPEDTYQTESVKLDRAKPSQVRGPIIRQLGLSTSTESPYTKQARDKILAAGHIAAICRAG